MTELEPLAKRLIDWTDWDFAAYELGRTFGLFPGQNFATDTKAVFWTDNKLGNGLHSALGALVAAGILEQRDEPDDQYRFSDRSRAGAPRPWPPEPAVTRQPRSNHRFVQIWPHDDRIS